MSVTAGIMQSFFSTPSLIRNATRQQAATCCHVGLIQTVIVTLKDLETICCFQLLSRNKIDAACFQQISHTRIFYLASF